ncbi:MAG: aspartate/glutamate racemase family protein [Rhodobacteraceae bacterium]|nr:aspartate/glutamate racemase family protein [Paracoccaceae bacterium]
MNDNASDHRARAAWLDDEDFGWRARIGVIVPSRGWTPDHEWPRMLPRGVSLFFTRIPLLATTAADLEAMGKHAVAAAELLASAEVDVICYGCTVETMMKGLDYDREVEAQLSRVSGRSAVTMTGAVLKAIEAFAPRKIAVVTPYIDELNRLERKFFADVGIDVCHLTGLGIANTVEIARIAPSEVTTLGRAALSAAGDADLLFLSCGNLRTLEAIPELEAALGKPVISSNQALIWSALRKVGIADKDIGVGSLFQR